MSHPRWEESTGTSRKFALASAIVGAGVAQGGVLGYGTAFATFVVYVLVNAWERRCRAHKERDR
jgi:hypothetical protein